MKIAGATKSESSAVRQRIIDTAARLFYQQGYQVTGINQLIDEAGVAKASLYQHFRTKDEVLKAYLQQASQEWFRQVDEAVSSGSTPKEKILAIFDMLKEFLVAVDYRGCNFQNALIQLVPGESDVRQFIQLHKTTMQEVFARVLVDSEPGLASELALLFEGAIITSQIHRSIEPVGTARRMAERLL